MAGPGKSPWFVKEKVLLEKIKKLEAEVEQLKAEAKMYKDTAKDLDRLATTYSKALYNISKKKNDEEQKLEKDYRLESLGAGFDPGDCGDR
jgi:predicted RNase H-like nuclease (RuvC/YqgF family)